MSSSNNAISKRVHARNWRLGRLRIHAEAFGLDVSRNALSKYLGVTKQKIARLLKEMGVEEQPKKGLFHPPIPADVVERIVKRVRAEQGERLMRKAEREADRKAAMRRAAR